MRAEALCGGKQMNEWDAQVSPRRCSTPSIHRWHIYPPTVLRLNLPLCRLATGKNHKTGVVTKKREVSAHEVTLAERKSKKCDTPQ